MIRNPWIISVTCTLLFTISLGCGGSDDPRSFDVSGVVTIDGQPIKVGRISFYPDTTNGNSGPAGTAAVHAGKFDTAAVGGKGTVGGPHRVLIENFVDAPVGEDGDIDEFATTNNNPIPNGIYVEWDIPNDTGSKIEKDFDVSPQR